MYAATGHQICNEGAQILNGRAGTTGFPVGDDLVVTVLILNRSSPMEDDNELWCNI